LGRRNPLGEDARYVVEAYKTLTASPGWKLLADEADSRKRALVARIMQEDVCDQERATLAAEFRAIESLMEVPRKETIRAEKTLFQE